NNAAFIAPANGLISALSIGDSAVVTAQHIITLTDMVTRVVNNMAFASAIDTGNVMISDSSDTVTTYVGRNINLAVSKTTDSLSITAGDSIHYIITITNNGPSSLDSNEIVSIFEQPAAGLTLGAFTTTNGDYNSINGELTLNSAFASGQSIALQVSALVDATVVDTAIANAVLVQLPSDVINTGDSTDTLYTPVKRWIDLAVNKTANLSSVNAGDSISYTITLTNNGITTLNAGEIVSIIEQPQAGLTIGSYATANGTYNSSNGDSILAGAFAKGQSITLDVTARVDANFGGDSIRNAILVHLPSDVVNHGDSTDADTTPVVHPVVIRTIDLAVVKITSVTSVNVGDSIAYTITVTNNGTSSLDSGEVITFTEQPQAGLTIGSYVSANGTYNNGALALNSSFDSAQSVVLS
ncbi:DUF11 domain-containing protein, partial [Symplocastrum sp. BBK-W-15]